MSGTSPDDPIFFATPAKFRAWLAKHHATAPELWVGFYKKETGKPSITWPESVDEALCVGWVDGVRKRLDEDSYVIRFTPRRPRSKWSAVNVARVAELTALGRMKPDGLAAFDRRTADGTASYAHQRPGAQVAFDPESERTFRTNERAWAFFETQPPGYRKLMTRWVTEAKRDETRQRRLAALIAESARGRRVDLLKPPTRSK
jgi:uncharacterized protein YdeI (YjbR/CyaY-like superfamily)